ncbi:MAG: glycogen synthase GlgA [Oscillospiraceae bacterium]|nr:glycogen synthase GlgA [Oscillospiraceae bacterium]
MNILFASSEAVPFIKSGGLADVAGALTKAVRNRGHACRVVLPLYDQIPDEMRAGMKFITYFNTPLAWRNQYCGIFEKTEKNVKYYFLDNEYYFKRGNIYGFYDDAERFAFFSRAVLEMINHIDFIPDIIHCNDWQTALIPVYLESLYGLNDRFRNIKTVFTIHNVAYQGAFDTSVMQYVLGLPESANHIVEYNGACNYMKGAIEQCDALTTVSPTYAGELMDSWFAHGLDPLLQTKEHKLRGILNGIDTKSYDPSTDPALTKNYSVQNLKHKAPNKAALQEEMGLAVDPAPVLIGMVTRLASHKGLDLVTAAFEQIMELPVQLVVLGTGEAQYQDFLREQADNYPGRMSVYIGFDEGLARKAYAGADVFLMPSQSEPCGLSQMIAMRYGAIPIVRLTGGLADSVHDFGGEGGNGYTFARYDPWDMLDAIKRAQSDYQNPDLWQEQVKAAIQCDFSWSRSAGEYIGLYQQLMGLHDDR